MLAIVWNRLYYDASKTSKSTHMTSFPNKNMPNLNCTGRQQETSSIDIGKATSTEAFQIKTSRSKKTHYFLLSYQTQFVPWHFFCYVLFWSLPRWSPKTHRKAPRKGVASFLAILDDAQRTLEPVWGGWLGGFFFDKKIIWIFLIDGTLWEG